MNQETHDTRKMQMLQKMDQIVPKQSGGFFGSVQYRPSMSFEGQNRNEKVYIMARRHWLTNMGWIINNLIYILIPFIIGLLLNVFDPKLPPVNGQVYAVLVLGYYSLILTNMFKNFVDWYFDIYFVTNERVMDVVFKPFSSYQIEEIPLSSIESVREKTPGILAALFNFGNITITTEANDRSMVFPYISRPTKVRDIISDLSFVARTYNNGN
jgi:hypothetical protein